MRRAIPPDISYVLPIRSATSQAGGELTVYLRGIARLAEVLVVDGSPRDVFASHSAAWRSFARHVAPAVDLVTPMGKVGGVLTGLRLASHERVVIADDDVRYDEATLALVASALDDADVVRPQNYFHPLPWHARLDTARMLLNRLAGGDWPGTLAVRRSVLAATGGYDGRAMFENLELVRTVQAAGGRERVLLDAYVPRRPASTRHFLSQRVRQAYDEFARPARLVAQLAFLPGIALVAQVAGWRGVLALLVSVVALAEAGRRRAGGARTFPAGAVLWAPLWIIERGVCSWVAVASRLARGGVRYRGVVLAHAATRARELRRRHAHLRRARDAAENPAAAHRSA